IEPFKDPGIYNSKRAKFQEWWTKTKAWLATYSGSFANDAEGCLAVWSRMEGPVAGVYAQAQIKKCTKANDWPTMAKLREQVDKFFSLQSEVNFTRNQIKDLRQGGIRIDEF